MSDKNPTPTDTDWLQWWGLHSSPCEDLPIKNSHLYKSYFITTKNTQKVHFEAQRIRRAREGYIRLLVGARGAGKTSSLYYCARILEESPRILPVFVELSHDTLEKITSTYSTVPLYASRLIASELLAAILEGIDRLNLVLREEASAKIKRLRELSFTSAAGPGPTGNESIPRVRTAHVVDAVRALREDNIRVVLAIDELDKLDRSDLIDLVSKYFKSEQAVFQTLASEGTVLIIGCSEKWSAILKHPDLSYMNYENRLSIERMSNQEVKTMLERRFSGVEKNGNYRFPFSNQAISGVNTYSSGNPRVILQRCMVLMSKGAERKWVTIERRDVDSIFGKEREERLSSDFDAAVALSESAERGAACIYRIASDLSYDPATSTGYLTALAQNEQVHLDASLLDRLIRTGCVERSTIINPKTKREESRIALSAAVKDFFACWTENYKHDYEEFLEWYPFALREPPRIPRTEKKLRQILRRSVGLVKEHLQRVIDELVNIDAPATPDIMVDCAWSMCEAAMLAFCLQFGFTSKHAEGGYALLSHGRVIVFGQTLHDAKKKFQHLRTSDPVAAKENRTPRFIRVASIGLLGRLHTTDHEKGMILIRQFDLALVLAHSSLRRHKQIGVVLEYYDKVRNQGMSISSQEGTAVVTLAKGFLEDLADLWYRLESSKKK